MHILGDICHAIPEFRKFSDFSTSAPGAITSNATENVKILKYSKIREGRDEI